MIIIINYNLFAFIVNLARKRSPCLPVVASHMVREAPFSHLSPCCPRRQITGKLGFASWKSVSGSRGIKPAAHIPVDR